MDVKEHTSPEPNNGTSIPPEKESGGEGWGSIYSVPGINQIRNKKSNSLLGCYKESFIVRDIPLNSG